VSGSVGEVRDADTLELPWVLVRRTTDGGEGHARFRGGVIHELVAFALGVPSGVVCSPGGVPAVSKFCPVIGTLNDLPEPAAAL